MPENTVENVRAHPLNYYFSDYENPTTNPQHIKAVFSLTFLAITFALLGYVFLGFFSYIDLQNLCYIQIEGTTNTSEKQAIMDAIRLIKDQSYSKYKSLCQHVKHINVSQCTTQDPENAMAHLRESAQMVPVNTNSCYIKGSKTIFVKPYIDMAQKKEALLEASAWSEQFWK
jgi:hypothetical protein